MLDESDLEFLAETFDEIVGDRPVTVTLRRNELTVGPYTVRLSRSGSFSVRTGPHTEQTVNRYVLLSSGVLDIQRGDRFNAYGFLFQIEAVSPQQVGIRAEVYMVQ